MPSYKDVEIRIRGAKTGGNGQPSIHDVEVRVEGSGLWAGLSTLDLESLDPSDSRQYGISLGAQLANPSLMRALDQAGLTRGDSIRLRLLLDDDLRAPHWIHWERLWIKIDREPWPIAAYPSIAFSRYIPVERPDEDPPDEVCFRLLYAIANPEGLNSKKAIDVETEIGNFLSSFETGPVDRRFQVSVLPGRTPISAGLRERIAKQGWKLLGGNTTLRDISNHLFDGFHGLHILAHGNFNPDTSVGSLLLENATGGQDLVNDGDLQSWITLDLQLVVFQACLSGATPAEGATPFTGLAPHLIRLGVPAAVAMQDSITMQDARIFFYEFYHTLLNDGCIDVAVSRGRQVLREQGALDNWSIPALFSRLRGGRLWRVDPLRQSLVQVLESLPAETAVPGVPMQAIEQTRGLGTYDPVTGASGPRFNLSSRLQQQSSRPGSLTILTGDRGYGKTTQLQRLFRELGTRFQRAETDAPMPVLVSLAELGEHTSASWPALARVWAGEAGEKTRDQIAGRRFAFLIDGNGGIIGTRLERALEAVRRLQVLDGSSLLLAADEELIPSLKDDFDNCTLLVMQSLEWPCVSAHLEGLQTDPARNLRKQIVERECMDLASQPRFLRHMLELSARGIPLTSRRQVIESLCRMYLARTNTQTVPKGCVEEAARRIAWQIQSNNASRLTGTELYPPLNAARGSREFALSDLMGALLIDSKLLVPSDDEGVRFAYAPFQAYFAAQYLAAAADRTRLLEDITASLGRLARIRRWEKTLILLASLLPCPGDLLRTILAGSPLLEGEQAFLAVRCYQEAIADGKARQDMDDVVDQMIDSLIWRSSWNPRRSYSDRQKAVQSLVALALVSKRRQPQVVPHLISLACDPIPGQSTQANGQRYEWAGIRQIAANGAMRILDETTKYIEDNRLELLEPARAWFRFKDDPSAISCLLARDDPRLSVIAAFALIWSQREEDRETLISSYERLSNPDVKWGIVETLGGRESTWVYERIISPWIKSATEEGDTAAEARREHICYLIEATSYAGSDGPGFLSSCLLNGRPWLQGKALRALAKLQNEEIEAWVRPLCEQILRGAANEIDGHKMNTTADLIREPTLRRSALKVLSDVGNAGSLDVIRGSRTLYANDGELGDLSFQVAEEIYWRLTGGLDTESYTGAAFQTARE